MSRVNFWYEPQDDQFPFLYLLGMFDHPELSLTIQTPTRTFLTLLKISARLGFPALQTEVVYLIYAKS